MKLNSVIFHTTKLPDLRDFYEGKLNLPTGTYVKENQTVPDYSDSYVNYHLGESLLCFEHEDGRTDIGTIILSVKGLRDVRSRIEGQGIKVVAGNNFYFKIKDPEGRSVMFEEERQG